MPWPLSFGLLRAGYTSMKIRTGIVAQWGSLDVVAAPALQWRPAALHVPPLPVLAGVRVLLLLAAVEVSQRTSWERADLKRRVTNMVACL